MFIPLIIPTSVKTSKKWVMNTMNIQFLGGYLVMFIALLPPLIVGWILEKVLSSSFGFMKDGWIAILFLFGLGLYFWNMWLKVSYQTEIKLVYIPLEYFAYLAVGFALFSIYA